MSHADENEIDLGSDLEFTKIEHRCAGGAWVNGKLHGHTFSALVFPEHAENPEYEIDDSKISKLWIQRIADKATVFNWDRGADIEPQTPLAADIVGFLCAGLADHTFAD
ncbi:hypothetical protein QQ056_07275 [Oscillatoria laete-virens NRMC-F 0139]|nr:hypothetical protein [Oscillatoria laete-virens]MDL5053344.1 hypothetical protein [Oscillatoria laete-virens NRMC-F 0139]